MDHTKVCTKCQEEYPATTEYFSPAKERSCPEKTYLKSHCKKCRAKDSRNRYQKHKDTINAKLRNQKLEMSEEELFEFQSNARHRHTQWRNKNRDHLRQYNRNKRKNMTTQERLAQNVRARTRGALNGKIKSGKTLDLLGCTPDEFKIHLERLFLDGMSWENYGNPNGDHSECWHIDHITPLAHFDLSDPEQQRRAFHYTNTQPLWAEDNLRKNAGL